MPPAWLWRHVGLHFRGNQFEEKEINQRVDEDYASKQLQGAEE